MLNFAGQNIEKGDVVIQIARTNQGMVQRVGVVLGSLIVNEDLRSRVGWYDPEVPVTSASESVVGVQNLVKVDPNTLPAPVSRVLYFVKQRGRAKL